MAGTRWQSGFRAAPAIALALLTLAAQASEAQALRKRHPDWTECPDTHLRLTARHADGTPVDSLKPQDLYLWFSTGTAEIRSMTSAEPANVLLVVRPHATISADAADAVMRNLQTAPALRWRIAVLGPEGSLTPFTAASEQAKLREALGKATASVAPADTATWTAAERDAFRKLKATSGRHVIAEVSQPGAEEPFEDHTLDLLARDDMAQIYKLNPRLSPPGRESFESTGGRGAASIDALFHDIVMDAPGSYDLTIHPLFSCQPGSSYSLRISSFRPEVELYYPSTVRMATVDAEKP